jgi:gas vesicle protein
MRVFLTGLVIGGMLGATASVVYAHGKQVGFRNQAEELTRRVREGATQLEQRRRSLTETVANAFTKTVDQTKELAGRTRSRFSGMRMPVWNGSSVEEPSAAV